MKKTIIKDGQVVLSDRIIEGDLLVIGGLIERIGGTIDAPGAEEIPAEGLLILPGIIDTHVHLREPGATHKESIATGSAAAVLGGVTSFLEMPNTSPTTTDQTRIDEKKSIAQQTSYANYGFYIGAATNNLDDVKSATGVPGIKVFAGSSTGDLLLDNQNDLERLFAESTLPIAAHCEDESTIVQNTARYAGHSEPVTHSLVRTPEAAARSIALLSDMAICHSHPLHILHVSSQAELEVIPNDDLVTAEVCIPHLFLDVEDYGTLGNRAKLNPAIRSAEDRKELWGSLRAGRFRNLSTDHAPHTLEEKSQPYPKAPSGVPSIENSLALMFNAYGRGELDITQLVSLMATAPADLWNLRNKGRIKEGFDGDLVLVDPNLERSILNEKQHTRAGWSPFHGRRLKGWPVRTLLAGETVALNNELVGPPRGQELFFD